MLVIRFRATITKRNLRHEAAARWCSKYWKMPDGQPFRVDGFRGLQDNFGSLYGVMDMRGISPLFLKGPHSHHLPRLHEQSAGMGAIRRKVCL